MRLEVIEQPGCGQRGVEHEHVAVERGFGEPIHIAALGEVRDHDLGRELFAQDLERVGPAPAEQQPRATARQRARNLLT